MRYAHIYYVGGSILSTESKREKFVRLANSRVNRALKNIRIVGNLANRSRYEYTEGDLEKIMKALRSELRTLQKRFEGDIDDENEFKLE